MLHKGTQALMHSPEGEMLFPLPVTVENEIGDLMEAFNRMVASIEEQRAAGFDGSSRIEHGDVVTKTFDDAEIVAHHQQ